MAAASYVVFMELIFITEIIFSRNKHLYNCHPDTKRFKKNVLPCTTDFSIKLSPVVFLNSKGDKVSWIELQVSLGDGSHKLLCDQPSCISLMF